MRNLKRALSLALASVMLLGMMVVGASAASINDFSDKDEIVNTEAVNTLVALNVINGKDDGTYDPTGIVTRAEMAKLITVALNGGKDPVLGTKPVPTYTDIRGNWAEAYIEYCTTLGIISGRGDGTFNPAGTVTGNEAAKMMLVAMGWDATIFNFTGASWAINVGVEANKVDLFDGLEDINPSEGLSRDGAAQLIYNGILGDTMEKDPSMEITNGQVTWNYSLSDNTIFSTKFGGKVFIGTFIGNENTTDAADKGQIVVNGKLDTADLDNEPSDANFASDLDIANIGEQVKVLFKDGTGGKAGEPDKKDTIYGVFNTGSTTVYNITKGDMQDAKDDAKVKFGGSKYSVADEVEVITNYDVDNADTIKDIEAVKRDNPDNPVPATTTAENLQEALKLQSVDTIKLVTDENGKINAAYVVEYKVARVTAVSSTKATLAGVGAITIEDHDIYADIAKDDVVVYTKFYDTNKDDALFTVVEAESVEGDLTGYKLGNGTVSNVVVDGTAYKAQNATLVKASDDALEYADLNSSEKDLIDDAVKIYLVNGMAAAMDLLDEGTSAWALVTSAGGTGLNNDFDALQVKVLYADGTSEKLYVHEDSVHTESTGEDAKKVAVKKADFDNPVLVKYTMSGSEIKIQDYADKGEIKDSESGKTTLLWDKDTKTLTYADGKDDVAASDAVMYIYAENTGKYTASNMRSLGDFSSSKAVSVQYNKNSSGQITAAYMVLDKKPGGATSDTLYGIVTDFVGKRSVDDESYFQYNIYTGGDPDKRTVVNVDAKLSVGTVVSFDEASDGLYVVKDFTLMPDSLGTAVAVKSYNEGSQVLSYYTGTVGTAADGFEGTDDASSITVDDDVVIVYVDADGEDAGDDIGVNAFDGNTGYLNAIIVRDEGVVIAIIVETSGEISMDALYD